MCSPKSQTPVVIVICMWELVGGERERERIREMGHRWICDFVSFNILGFGIFHLSNTTIIEPQLNDVLVAYTILQQLHKRIDITPNMVDFISNKVFHANI